MKSKNFIILIAICCGLAAVAYIILIPPEQAHQSSRLGQKPFENLAVNDVTAITITSPESEVILQKQSNGWTVANRFNYSADFPKIADFVKKIKSLTIGRSFEASPDAISRLALHRPDRNDMQINQKGVRILLADSNKNTLLDLIIGKARESSAGIGGQYVLPSATSTAYLVDRDFRFLEKEPSEWLELSLLNIKAQDIEQVIARAPGRKSPLYTLKRPAREKAPIFVDIPDKKTATASKIDQVFEALLGLEISDVSDPNKPIKLKGFESKPHLEYYLFDGTVYRIYPGNAVDQENKQFYLKVEAAFLKPKPELPDERLSSRDDETASPKNESELRTQIQRLNSRISPWVYIVSNWKMERFITDPEELFEK
jgi:hypothetical protein